MEGVDRPLRTGDKRIAHFNFKNTERFCHDLLNLSLPRSNRQNDPGAMQGILLEATSLSVSQFPMDRNKLIDVTELRHEVCLRLRH